MCGRSHNSLTCSAPAPPCCQCCVLFEFHSANGECHPTSVHPTSEKPSIHLKPRKPKPSPRNQLYTPGRFQIPLSLNNVASDIKSTSRIHTHNTNPQTPSMFTKLKRIRAQPTHAHNTITAKRNQNKSQTNHIKPGRKRQAGRKLRLTLRRGETHRVEKRGDEARSGTMRKFQTGGCRVLCNGREEDTSPCARPLVFDFKLWRR